ncbi:MAG: 50S ribosomal protein L22 [Candidatus Zixiibacteriota bacterium]
MLVKSSAQLRYLSIPPRKMRLVANAVIGMPVEKALNILNFMPKIAAHHLAKTLKSAAANALSKEGTDNLNPEVLTIKSIIVDAAPTAKRIRYRSMGRVYRYRKRFCHLIVNVEGHTIEPEAKKASTAGAAAEKTVEKTAGKKESASGKKKAVKTTKKAVKKTAAKKTGSAKSDARKRATKARPKTEKKAEK